MMAAEDYIELAIELAEVQDQVNRARWVDLRDWREEPTKLGFNYGPAEAVSL